MLQNDFYTLFDYECLNAHLTATIYLNAQHAIYKGHFPNQPVLPGVCMVQIVKEMAEQALSKNLMLSEARQIKFLELVDPNKTKELNVEMKWSILEDRITMEAAFKTKERIVFKFQGTFH